MGELIVGALLAIVPFLLFALTFRLKKRWRVLPFALYLLSYLPLTLMGRFEMGNHGGMDWQVEWCPKYLMGTYKRKLGRTSVGISPIGAAFWPLLVLDHLDWHRTHEPTDTEWRSARPVNQRSASISP